jgi:hypothetical protein
MSIRRPVLCTLALALSIALPGATLAEPFAYVAGDLATSNVSSIVQSDSLFLVDLATGEAVTVGQIVGVGCSGVGDVCTTVGE